VSGLLPFTLGCGRELILVIKKFTAPVIIYGEELPNRYSIRAVCNAAICWRDHCVKVVKRISVQELEQAKSSEVVKITCRQWHG